MQYDFIIVGQGIAGTLLSYELIKREQKVLVIDQELPGASSKMAAGIINPITGRRLVKSWMFDELLPVLNSTYQELEKELNISILHEMEILKLLSSNKEINDFQIKKDDPKYAGYLFENEQKKTDYLQSTEYLYAALIKNAFRLDGNKLITTYRQWLKERNFLLDETFSDNHLKINTNYVKYKDHITIKIIFCDGFKCSMNPLFKQLPLVPAKGDLLTIESNHIPHNYMINKNFFILPIGNNRFKVGSTYDWKFSDYEPNPNSKETLKQKLTGLLSVSFDIVEHTSGIRPSTTDRRPFIGMHTKHPNIGLFNGFGTKAFSLVPFFAKHFTSYLLNRENLMDEVNITRFNG